MIMKRIRSLTVLFVLCLALVCMPGAYGGNWWDQVSDGMKNKFDDLKDAADDVKEKVGEELDKLGTTVQDTLEKNIQDLSNVDIEKVGEDIWAHLDTVKDLADSQVKVLADKVTTFTKENYEGFLNHMSNQVSQTRH